MHRYSHPPATFSASRWARLRGVCLFVFLLPVFFPGAGRLEALTISEIMYSPRGEVQKRFEFIELFN
ncbi:MAG: hypothetical protein MK554_12810, partial [Planctomycetes bacterium]|nr:hypothetical protein [Planctomycetota bacterium]